MSCQYLGSCRNFRKVWSILERAGAKKATPLLFLPTLGAKKAGMLSYCTSSFIQAWKFLASMSSCHLGNAKRETHVHKPPHAPTHMCARTHTLHICKQQCFFYTGRYIKSHLRAVGFTVFNSTVSGMRYFQKCVCSLVPTVGFCVDVQETAVITWENTRTQVCCQ